MFNFKIEGSFLTKPVLTIDGQPVPFSSLSAVYHPEVIYSENDKDPEFVGLSFSLSEKIGNLEANTTYRVRAEKDGKLTLVVDAKCKEKAEDDMCEDCSKEPCTCKDMSKKKKVKSSLDLLIENVTK